MTQENSIAQTGRFAFLSAIFGIITTIVRYTGYGVGDHIEQLPIIVHMLDSTYLLNDFFTNASINNYVRIHYANIVALLAGSEHNLPLIFLILTFCANILISVISFHMARHLFNNSNLAGIYASALVMTISTFSLGWLPTLYTRTLVPSTIAIPLVLGAIWAVAVHKNLIVGLLLSGIASIIHPLMGLETGGVLLITYAAFHFINKQKIGKDEWKVIIPSLLIATTFFLISFIPHFLQQSLDSNSFIYIIAYFRHPHHYVPSTFGLSQYVYTSSFLSASFLILHRRRQTFKESANFILILGIIILLVCIGGYIFVEILPSRIWVTAQTFRLLYIVKWLGLVLIGGTIADFSLKRNSLMESLYMVSVFSPLTLGVTVLSQTCKDRLERNFSRFSKILEPSLILLVNIAILLYLSISFLTVLFFVGYILSILVFRTLEKKFLYLFILISTTSIILVSIFHSRIPIPTILNTRIRKIKNNLTLGITNFQLGTDGILLAKFAQNNTPQDTVFLTPPDWGQFRLLAKRAIVVDFKAFPFADDAILEWYERITNCYGSPTATGFSMIDELSEYYRHIDDSKLRKISEQYDFSYAVLYSETPTNFNIIFQNGEYKIIELHQRYP